MKTSLWDAQWDNQVSAAHSSAIKIELKFQQFESNVVILTSSCLTCCNESNILSKSQSLKHTISSIHKIYFPNCLSWNNWNTFVNIATTFWQNGSQSFIYFLDHPVFSRKCWLVTKIKMKRVILNISETDFATKWKCWTLRSCNILLPLWQKIVKEIKTSLWVTKCKLPFSLVLRLKKKNCKTMFG